MLSEPYPRDMIGYGRVTPDPEWPDAAKLAVQFVINYEEGGENNILHGDPSSEAFLSEIVGAEPWIGQRNPNMESIYEYGSRAGFWRLWRLFTARNMPVTVFAVATALQRNPDAVSAMLEADWEIASHGLKWINYQNFDEEVERQHMTMALAIHEAATGAKPDGWYTGRTSEQTLKLVVENGGFAYTADSYADDLPFWSNFEGKRQLVVPYTLDANDMRFATSQGFNSGDQFFAYLKDSFDVLLAEGQAGSPKMMSIGLHCRLVGRPGRTAALERFLDYVQSHEDVWVTRRIDIARHWEQFKQPKIDVRPSKMDRLDFVQEFGGIYEHSPWIAERVFADGLKADTDTANGLHHRMSSVFHGASDEEKLGVLKAHPDLAGRLARAGKLTAESAKEQASAGLDALTAKDLAQFKKLNADYKAKFDIPFIIAAKGRSKGEIQGLMEQRLGNEKETEIKTALAQVDQIARLRLLDLLP